MNRFRRVAAAVPMLLTLPLLLILASQSVSQSKHLYADPKRRLQVLFTQLSAYGQIWESHREPMTPLFNQDDDVLVVRSGDYQPSHFTIIPSPANTLQLESEFMQGPGGSLPLRTRITYELRRNQLRILYRFEATATVEVSNGLDIRIMSSKWKCIQSRNHFSNLESILCEDREQDHHHALQQVYEFSDEHRRMVLLFPNPYHSLVSISERAPLLLFHWHILPASSLIKAQPPKGPGFASVLEKGFVLERELQLFVLNQVDQPIPFPLAYLSPYPNGFDQLITIGLDDIPFYRWTIPGAGDDNDSPIQRQLIALLQNHPLMKMSWLMVPDAIIEAQDLANPDYPSGKWWQAHSVHRILTAAPEAYKQWLRNIDRHRQVLGYEDRVALGNHGLHHTPEREYGHNWEFQYNDPVLCDSTFSAILREYDQLGLSSACRQWIRFPGFMFSRSAVDALIKNRFVLFDYDQGAIGAPWVFFLAPQGRIWGLQVQWEGDSPQPYSVMDQALSRGMVCHCAGHPGVWFKGGDPAAFARLDSLFFAAERNYPHLGYLWPDELAQFAEQTARLQALDMQYTTHMLIFSFFGQTDGQSLYLEWPQQTALPTYAFVDDQEAGLPLECRNARLICRLPKMPAAEHRIRIPFPAPIRELELSTTAVTAQSVGLNVFSFYPNPFNHSTKILFRLPDSACAGPTEIALYNAAGQRVRTLFSAEAPPGLHELNWDGRDDRNRPLATGVYFCRFVSRQLVRTLKVTLVP
ncbi:hypothetical protein GX408_13360 [bacterium]|nr:hypothetical protein [bacterium]